MYRAHKLFVAVIFGLLAFTYSTSAGVKPVNSSLFGKVAIEGYDAVAYHTEAKPVKGSKEFTHEWQGAIWRFASAANLETFRKEPMKYAPAYGGYCAWAVSQGYTASIDPAAWKIVGGKLYLNYNQEIKNKWEKEQAKFIEDADANWPKLLAD